MYPFGGFCFGGPWSFEPWWPWCKYDRFCHWERSFRIAFERTCTDPYDFFYRIASMLSRQPDRTEKPPRESETQWREQIYGFG